MMEHRDPKTYWAKKRRLKAIYEEWGRRLSAAAGRSHGGYVSPSRLCYGSLVAEYCYARDKSRWFRGFGEKPRRDR